MEEKKLEFSPYGANEAHRKLFLWHLPIELVNSSLYKGKIKF